MSNLLLEGCRVLVVEDEVMLAYDLSQSLAEAGASVLGPSRSVGDALDLLKGEYDLHGAVLDVNLGGEMVFPVADALAIRGVPFVFATGYDQDVVPERYAYIRRCEKPVSIDAVIHAVGDAMFAFLAPGNRRRRELQAQRISSGPERERARIRSALLAANHLARVRRLP